jgi:hypothetical protein
MIKFNLSRFIIKKNKNIQIKISIFNSSLITLFQYMFNFFKVSKQRKEIMFFGETCLTIPTSVLQVSYKF